LVYTKGVAWDCYSGNGSRATVPTARGVVCCPDCGAGRVHVELVSSSTVVPPSPTTRL